MNTRIYCTEEFWQIIDDCNATTNKFIHRRYSELDNDPNYHYSYEQILYIIRDEFIRSPPDCSFDLKSSNLFVRQINLRILFELNFHETNSLTINVNQLFDCSAKVHFRNESFESNVHEINNCFQYFNSLKSIYANEEIGICFEFFAKNYSIYLREEDYIEIIVKYKSQINVLVSPLLEMNYRFSSSMSRRKDFFFMESFFKSLFIYDQYFGLYFFVDPKTRLVPKNRDIAIKSNKNSLNAELRITKKYVELLTKPYMNKCTNYGKF